MKFHDVLVSFVLYHTGPAALHTVNEVFTIADGIAKQSVPLPHDTVNEVFTLADGIAKQSVPLPTKVFQCM